MGGKNKEKSRIYILPTMSFRVKSSYIYSSYILLLPLLYMASGLFQIHYIYVY